MERDGVSREQIIWRGCWRKKANGELSEALKAKWKTKPEVIKRLVGEKKTVHRC